MSKPARRISVLLPLPLAEAYDYRVPDGMEVKVGDFVVAPLGPRLLVGAVWGDGKSDDASLPEKKLKPIEEVLPVPPLPEAARRFVDWVASYTMSPPGAVLRMSMSVSAALKEPRSMVAYQALPRPAALKLTGARKRVLDLLADGPPRGAAELAREAGCGSGVVKGLLEAGAIEAVEVAARPRFAVPDAEHAGPTLSPDQADVAGRLRAKVGAGYSATLLDGVTGSGKTEVYYEAIAACLAAGRQALVLLPEIALSPQWLDRFAARFGARPAEWHSDLTGTTRRATWRAIATGEARVVVGARSALFLPYPDLGLIIVDEEHEAAFKQEDGVVYHARDMAVARAFLGGIPIVLVSATPSLETLANVEARRYARLHLPERHGGALLPEVTLLDLRRKEVAPAPRRWLSPVLVKALADTFAAGEQAMLFLNRRGYAPLTLCRACGFRLQCPHCTAWLVEHRLTRRLQCHHCGHVAPLPENCPHCDTPGAFVACGPGVERVAEEVAERFPGIRAALMTSDTLVGPLAIQDVIDRVRRHEVDLLIGTQVMAKGHHFPLLTLVGVVDADLGLAGGDLRAGERTFQLLHQVAGRAGRESRPGRVFLQTHMPEHPVMQALKHHDRDAFFAAESDARRAVEMPPYGRLAALIVSGPDAGAVDDTARRLARAAPGEAQGVQVLGPAPAPLALLRGRHRRRLLMKGARGIAMQPLVASWLERVKVPNSVRVQVDIDPYSFM